MKYMKNINKIFLTSIVLVLLAVTAGATKSVTYSCCKNYIISSGTLLEDFEGTYGFTVGGVGATLANDSLNYSSGTMGLILQSTVDYAVATKTVSWDLSNTQNLSFDLWVDNYSNFLEMAFILSNDSGFTKTFTKSIYASSSGKFKINIDKYDSGWVSAGGVLWSDRITRFRVISYMSTSNSTQNITIDNLRVNYSGRAKVVLAFDDGADSVIDLAYPVMQANNQRGVSYVVTNWAQGIPPNSGMLVPDLTTLKNSGWDVSSHTKNHTNLVTSSNLTEALNDSYDWLVNNGFHYSAWNLAYPGGLYNQTVINAVKQRYIFGRTVTNRVSPHLNSGSNEQKYSVPGWNIISSTTPQSIYNAINTTVNTSGLLVLLFHNISDSAGDTEYSLANFTLISNHLAARTDIDVITFRDYVDINIPNNTPVLNNTVDIYSNGSTIFNGSSVYDETVSMTVFPSSGSVAVKVSVWNTTGDYRKVLNLSASASVTMGDFAPNTDYWILKNGVKWNIYKSNALGKISFSDTISSETQYSTSLATAQESYTSSTCKSTLNWGVVGSSLIIILIIIGAGGLAIGFLTGTMKLDSFPIEEFVLGLVAVVIIGGIGVAIISPIMTLAGCT